MNGDASQSAPLADSAASLRRLSGERAAWPEAAQSDRLAHRANDYRRFFLPGPEHRRTFLQPYSSLHRAPRPLDPGWRFRADFAFSLDQLTLVMLLIVTGVGFLIHIYSIGYMAHEEGFWRFFAYLNLFMFFMLTLVLAENFLFVFVGWEGVGLASYLLIGFYFAKNSAANAGKKAFVVNRIGDFGFLLAMFLTIAHFGTLSFDKVFAQIAAHPEYQGGFLTAIALFLILGATGKSAQIPLYIWLPDAMEGPTPVSALIHAATMVTAGVYMTARCHAIFDRSPLALSVIAIIGAVTAFFAATMGMVQTDIKRVLAYSTISQLGYMFLACGVAAYSAGIFHLLTHAFFKALLFLAAGSVIHALDGEQDMRVMGGLRNKDPDHLRDYDRRASSRSPAFLRWLVLSAKTRFSQRLSSRPVSARSSGSSESSPPA